ncbi:MAG TPA: hypothetical protein VFL93_02640 [Longimicrobiaceae bacterium]|jgi:hypothetical protein|nr:hypothetical protein [Longimicrobiaceae bacterium]
MRHLPLAPLALAIAALALALNLFLLWEIRHPERLVGPLLQSLPGGSVDSSGVLHYDVRVPAGTPLALDLPIDERFDVAVDTVIPLNTTVRVPIHGPLGVANVKIPIRADVPLHTALPLRIQHTFHLRTKTTQPIEIPLRLDVR